MSWAWGNRSGFSNHVSNLLCAASICAGSARAFILHASQRGFLSQTLFSRSLGVFCTVRVRVLRPSSGPATGKRLLDKDIFKTRNPRRSCCGMSV